MELIHVFLISLVTRMVNLQLTWPMSSGLNKINSFFTSIFTSLSEHLQPVQGTPGDLVGVRGLKTQEQLHNFIKINNKLRKINEILLSSICLVQLLHKPHIHI